MWQKAIQLAVETYRVAARLPVTERYEMSAQLRRAVVSVPANIAEGHGRWHRAEYGHHLSIARGSLAEVETCLVLAVRLHFIAERDLRGTFRLSDEVGRMLTAMMKTLRSPR
ncbi:MAG: four helix bundle protein [Gemmatimonadaceae bacterium]